MLHDTITFAVDFDGTLYLGGGFPSIVPDSWNGPLVTEIMRLQAERPNDKWILWTCRSGVDLEMATKALSRLPIKWDAINDNTIECQRRYGCNPRKVIADIYIDDCATSALDACDRLRLI